MLEIPTTLGKTFIIDDEDLDLISQYKWHAYEHRNTYYVSTNVKTNGKWTTVGMPTIIMKAKDRKQLDHKNGNGLDNRKENLRYCSSSQNSQNRHGGFGTSPFKGVHWHKPIGKWCSRIGYEGSRIILGYFASEEDAARAYDSKAKELFGEFANLNFKEEVNRGL